MTPATLRAAATAPAHPALRWTPVLVEQVDRAQHRVPPGAGVTVCGLDGPFTLAEPVDPKCERGCWA